MFNSQTFNELFFAHKTEGDILAIVSKAEEFEQVKVRVSTKIALNMGLI